MLAGLLPFNVNHTTIREWARQVGEDPDSVLEQVVELRGRAQELLAMVVAHEAERAERAAEFEAYVRTRPESDLRQWLVTVVPAHRVIYDNALAKDTCTCGHPYYRHFDPYEGNAPVGCKYCPCHSYVSATTPHLGQTDPGPSDAST